MKIIFLNHKSGQSRLVTRSRRFVAGMATLLLGVPTLMGMGAGYYIAKQEPLFDQDAAQLLRNEVTSQRESITDLSIDTTEQVRTLAIRLSELQARLLRLDVLGQRLITAAKLDSGEFDFGQKPALGGPDTAVNADDKELIEALTSLQQLQQRLQHKEDQLVILETLLADRKISNDVYLAGRPIGKGWMSSAYGMRIDPINGRRQKHNGVDFAGSSGDEVIAVAAGVVTWADKRSGYGQMVEINHGSGYTTRYGHHQELLVRVGDIVKKGQAVGLMGSSGRSTGPHVHFEVYRNGRLEDPATYIHRNGR